MTCTLCSNSTQLAFMHRILNKYDCRYYLCSNCGLLQTEEPYWLGEAYASSIAIADTGILQRNITNARRLSKLLFLFFDRSGMYADIAGGYGILVRLMRDYGYDFFWHDPYTENIHARGFEADMTGETAYEAITAFEVIEHLRNPLDFFSNALCAANTHTIILSTELYADTPPAPDSWWYYSFGTGQHIAFYQRTTLAILAKKLNVQLFSYKNIHILTSRSLHPLLLRMALSSRSDFFLNRYMQKQMKSKTIRDHEAMLLN